MATPQIQVNKLAKELLLARAAGRCGIPDPEAAVQQCFKLSDAYYAEVERRKPKTGRKTK